MDAGRSSRVEGNAAAPWRFLMAVAIVGIVARLAFGVFYWTGQPLTRDEYEYLSLARSLAAGHGFVYDEVMRSGSFTPFGRAPGYPAFLALVGAGHGVATAAPVSVKVAQALVGGAGILLVGLLTLRFAGARAARAAATIAALYPPLVWISAYVLSEALFWPVGLLLALLFDRARSRAAERGGAMMAFLTCGLVFGAAVLIRPALLLFLPLAGLLLLWQRQTRGLAVFVLGAALVLGPWTLRNHQHHGRWMIVASDGGVTFWTGNHPMAIGEGDMAAVEPLKRDNLRLREQYPGLSEEEMEPIYYREAFAWIRANPWRWVGLELRKAFYLVVPIGPSYWLHSPRYYVTSWIAYGTILVLAVIGARQARRRLGRTAGLWMLAGSAVLVCLVFFPQERFRIPVIDPALVVLAGAAFASRDARTKDR